jgi:hypothetical protein
MLSPRLVGMGGLPGRLTNEKKSLIIRKWGVSRREIGLPRFHLLLPILFFFLPLLLL